MKAESVTLRALWEQQIGRLPPEAERREVRGIPSRERCRLQACIPPSIKLFTSFQQLESWWERSAWQLFLCSDGNVVVLELTSTLLLSAVLYFLLQVSFLVDEGVSPVLLQLLSCALCGSKVLAALAASTGTSSSASSSAPAASSSGQATTQPKSSTKKSKKEEKEKEKDGENHHLVW